MAADLPPLAVQNSGVTLVVRQAIAGEKSRVRHPAVQIVRELQVACRQIGQAVQDFDHLLIEPAEVSLAAGQQVDFGARAVDSFGNAFALEGVTVAWHCWPATLGAIDPRTGLFTAGAAGGDGCVVAVVSRSLRFGDAEVAAVTGTGRITVQGARPSQFALHPNSPNPFNAQTVIRYELIETGPTSLTVADMLGRRVATLVNESKVAGTYEARFDATTLPSGMYFCVLQTTTVVKHRMMQVMK